MGTYKGGSPTYRKLQENYDKIKESYPVSNGYIGMVGLSGKSHIREISTSNPIREAQKLYDTIAYGGIESNLPNGKGIYSVMKDGSVITFRVITSTKGSPAVDINIKHSTSYNSFKTQKIHFTKEIN